MHRVVQSAHWFSKESATQCSSLLHPTQHSSGCCSWYSGEGWGGRGVTAMHRPVQHKEAVSYAMPVALPKRRNKTLAHDGCRSWIWICRDGLGAICQGRTMNLRKRSLKPLMIVRQDCHIMTNVTEKLKHFVQCFQVQKLLSHVVSFILIQRRNYSLILNVQSNSQGRN